MREIKFRAWDKKRKVMRFVNEINFSIKSVQCEPKDGFDSNLEMYDPICFDGEYELMQFTGLKDKNGVEIYEGDIVEIGWSDQVGEAHHWRTTIKNPFDYSTEEALNLIHSEYIEIIGNIYENPELLGG